MSMFIGINLLALFIGGVVLFVRQIREDLAAQRREIELEKKYRGTIR